LSDGERRLAAIMFTDIVGYTRLMQENESATVGILKHHRELIRPLFVSHGGREIKTIGDAFLVEFGSALDATLCAIAVQNALYDRRLSRGEKLDVRIGIHVGDVIESKGDIIGDAVNIASRVVPLAEPGGVCISEQVCDQIKNKIPYQLVKMGKRELKNVRGTVDIYRVILPWEKLPERESEAPVLDKKRVAVLPFSNFSPDPNDEYFSDGLTEELINRVSLVRGLEVIARTSAMNYKKEKKSITQIARELNVGTLLEGSVRKAGNRIRVSAQLINANTEGHLWAETYARDLQDIFEVQSSIAENVAEALKLKLLEVRERVEPTADIDAYTMYLRAMQLLHEGTKASCKESISLFKEAISKDPTFVHAYAGLSRAWHSMGPGTSRADFTMCVSRAEAAARRALDLGPRSAEAYTAMARVHGALDRFEEEHRELEKAIQINPNLVEAIRELGWYYAVFGRFDEALECLRRACSLDPLDPGSGLNLTMVLRVTGRVDEALEVVRGLKELHRRRPSVYFQTACCYLQKKDFGKARVELDNGLRFEHDDWFLRVFRGVTYALSGRREEAQDELRDLMEDESEARRLGAQAWIRTALGDLDEAFEALMRGAELHSWWGLIKFDPLFEGLWKDPRFSEFCKKVGLPP